MSQSHGPLHRELEELEVSSDLALAALREYFENNARLLGEIAAELEGSPERGVQDRIKRILNPERIDEQTRLMLETIAFVNQHSETTKKTLLSFQSEIQHLKRKADDLENGGEGWKAE